MWLMPNVSSGRSSQWVGGRLTDYLLVHSLTCSWPCSVPSTPVGAQGPWELLHLGRLSWVAGDSCLQTLPDGTACGLPTPLKTPFPLLSPQPARHPEEVAEPRAMVPSRRTWNLGATPSLRGLWRVGRVLEPKPGMARPAPASPAARPFPHTGQGRLRTGESAFLECLFISLPSSRSQR